jgi:hypothetical protein
MCRVVLWDRQGKDRGLASVDPSRAGLPVAAGSERDRTRQDLV